MICPNCGFVIQEKRKRSLDQNAISHEWYGQLAARYPQDDALGWKSYCKLHFGVPLLRAEDDQFREFYDRHIKAFTYEQKLDAMKFLPVTSLMKTLQMSKYLEAMQQEWGFLKFPMQEAA